MVLDDALEERDRRDPRAATASAGRASTPRRSRASNRKQAIVPAGATILDPVGTAPGLVVPPASGNGGPTVVVLPGPPRELQDDVARGRSGRHVRRRDRGGDAVPPARRCGSTASRSPRSPRRCARPRPRRRGSTASRSRPACGAASSRSSRASSRARKPAYAAFEAVVRERHGDTLFSTDGSTIDQQVAALLLDGGRTIATAESCTGGLLAGRLTDLAGSSAYVLGGLVVYSNAAKTALAGVPADLIDRAGAVSTEVAEALADGARARLGADVGVGITGVAGPGGGTATKPVGLVCFSVAGPDGRRITRSIRLPGNRADVRDRSTTIAMHLVRRLLRGETDAAAIRI